MFATGLPQPQIVGMAGGSDGADETGLAAAAGNWLSSCTGSALMELSHAPVAQRLLHVASASSRQPRQARQVFCIVDSFIGVILCGQVVARAAAAARPRRTGDRLLR